MTAANDLSQFDRHTHTKLVDRAAPGEAANRPFVTHVCDPLFRTTFCAILVIYSCTEGVVVTHDCGPCARIGSRSGGFLWYFRMLLRRGAGSGNTNGSVFSFQTRILPIPGQKRPPARSRESVGCNWIAMDWDGCDSRSPSFRRKIIAVRANWQAGAN
jgi:hypothetical protein